LTARGHGVSISAYDAPRRLNTDNSGNRYDVVFPIHGVPAAKIELRALGINPRRAMERLGEYKNDPGETHSRRVPCPD
jgi:type I restriction enzyme, R subunit